MMWMRPTRALKSVLLCFSVGYFLLINACVTTTATSSHRKTRSSPPKALSSEDRQRIVQLAQKSLGKSSIKIGKKSFRGDCSGTVRGIFSGAGVGLGGVIKDRADNDVKAIYRYIQKYGTITKSKPEPGDLVFFHNTYDRSRNGRMNDALTHIGVVEKTEGTLVHFIHHLGHSIIRSRMDLSQPKLSIDPKTNKRLNHVLRKAQGPYPAFTSAELFAGFGHL